MVVPFLHLESVCQCCQRLAPENVEDREEGAVLDLFAGAGHRDAVHSWTPSPEKGPSCSASGLPPVRWAEPLDHGDRRR